MRRRTVLSLVLLAATLGLAAAPARAATEAPFTQQAFAAAQKAGKPILLHITAPWCPTCAKQHPILSELYKSPEFRDLVVYDVDFDTQKSVLRAMNVRMQSTLIAFHGSAEQARSTGDTDAASIKRLVEKAGS